MLGEKHVKKISKCPKFLSEIPLKKQVLAGLVWHPTKEGCYLLAAPKIFDFS